MEQNMARHRIFGIPRTALWTTLLGSWLALGCGQWEQFDGEQPAAGISSLDDLGKISRMDHLALSGLLRRFLVRSSDGALVLADYDGINNSEEAKYLLDQSLALAATVDPSELEDKNQRLAYWINGYNAAVIKGVLLLYKGDHGFKVTKVPFFRDYGYIFGGVQLSLDQLEQGVVRGKLDHEAFKGAKAIVTDAVKKWHKELWQGGKVDARIHAAFNCAARSCPNLLDQEPHVFHPGTLDTQLKWVTQKWLDSKLKGAGSDGISRLFDWYGEDFVASHGSVEAFIKAHRSDGITGVDTRRYLTYDWTLNIAPTGGVK